MNPGAKVEFARWSVAVNPLKMQEMLEQARNMQAQMQERLSHTVVEASSGGGAVTVKMNGQKQVLQLKIDAAAMMSLTSSPADVEMLEDLLTAAFNEASRRADDAMKSNLTGMLGGLNLPPGLI
jgi:nucleoid-associated protein EbfC